MHNHWRGCFRTHHNRRRVLLLLPTLTFLHQSLTTLSALIVSTPACFHCLPVIPCLHIPACGRLAQLKNLLTILRYGIIGRFDCFPSSTIFLFLTCEMSINGTVCFLLMRISTTLFKSILFVIRKTRPFQPISSAALSQLFIESQNCIQQYLCAQRTVLCVSKPECDIAVG